MSVTTTTIKINEWVFTVHPGQTILEVAESQDLYIPHICYHTALGPIQSCDTCVVEVNGELKRACATKAYPGLVINSLSPLAKAGQLEAMERILENHELYCTVCDNNNG